MKIFTIGHSNHDLLQFIDLLKRHEVNAVADVRSTPYSRWQPQFNREPLLAALRTHGVSYVFVGAELGARSDDPACHERGQVKYRRLAETGLFRSGLERVLTGAQRMNVALMCAEKDPLECHRTILVAREIVTAGGQVEHILSNGDIEPHDRSMKRLLLELGLPEHDLFRSDAEIRELAYAMQEERIAYIDTSRAAGMEDAGT